MPKMSMTMTEGEVVGWTVETGTEVSAGDTVCEVLTDKVDMEVESPVSGRLVRVDVESGVAQVGDPIGWIETEDEDALAGLFDEPVPAAATEPAPEPEKGPEPDPVPARVGPVPAVPRARALAKEHGVNLAALHGTGPDGRVLVADVEEHARTSAPTEPSDVPPAVASSASPAPAAPTAASASRAAAPAPAPAAVPAPSRSRRGDAVRAAVARTMTASASVPQFTVWRDLDLEPADAARGGISWTTVLLRGYVTALREVPSLLGQWDGQRVTAGERVSVALAVDTPDGLLVPVFADPDLVGIEQLDADVRATVASARAGRIDAAHLLPATATLSNLGGLDVDRFQALVTPPQASVLAAGSIGRRPVAVPGGLGLGLRLTVGLSVDHRVADGADGARLLTALAAAVADPLRLFGPVGASAVAR